MHFQFNVSLTENDYLAFNHFHSLESKAGRKLVRKNRIVFASIMAVLMTLFVLVMGWTPFSTTYVVLIGIFTILYLVFYKKIIKRNIHTQIKHLRKTGKLPFDVEAAFEFYEDHLVEITPTKRTEQHYQELEKICIVENRYIYLYYSSIATYIIPIPQLRQQADEQAFIRFMSEKCSTVEHY